MPVLRSRHRGMPLRRPVVQKRRSQLRDVLRIDVGRHRTREARQACRVHLLNMPTPRKKPTKKRPGAHKKRPKIPEVSLWDTLLGRLFGEQMSWEPPQSYPDPQPSQSFDEALLQEMLREGYRTLAKRYHPDLEGGSAEKMTELNLTKSKGAPNQATPVFRMIWRDADELELTKEERRSPMIIIGR